ncbi:dof zinc finger protein DOF5.1-like [Panicum miliaceum]|uniref:Dof zinc finger protein DOF5.1-like n=1 Tax=Panicum miliaceum TaxID=4540 RepID=A0A3L6R888_PANMI|nr:dof zinc finger protein DOF5.1-like [Panicum miliaceum]
MVPNFGGAFRTDERGGARGSTANWTAGGAIRVPVGSGRRKNRPVLPPPPPAPHAGDATATATSADHVSESGSPPVFTTASGGLAVPYRGSPFHLAPSPACTAAGLPETAGQYWWLVAGGAARAVAPDRAFLIREKRRVPFFGDGSLFSRMGWNEPGRRLRGEQGRV